MNKTISINVGGFAFTIEEDAYQVLYHYLNSIKKNFSDAAERDEIMQDIESRIAEIFKEKLGNMREVLMTKDIDEMIQVMGKPEDYVSEGATHSHTEREKSSAYSDASSQDRSQKRLYRDTENAALGGVCAGLSHYFSIDVTLVRIIFILLTILGGSGLLIYLVLLFFVPEAKTTADYMQMKGQAVNLENIKEHFKKIKDDITDSAKSGKFKKVINDTVNKSAQVGSNAVQVFVKFLGFAFVVGGTFSLIILFIVLFGNSGLIPLIGSEHSEDLATFIDIVYPGSFQSTLVFISVLAVTLIPIISILVAGVKMLFNIKANLRFISITSGVIWTIAAAILVITGIGLGMSMRSQNSVSTDIPFADSTNTLYVDVAHDEIFSNHLKYNDVWNTSELISLQNDQIYIGYPELKLTHKRDSGNFEIILHRISNGLSNQDAISKAEQISYQVEISNHTVWLPAYYSFPATEKLRDQEVLVEIRIPEGKKVILGENIDRIDLEMIPDERDYEISYAGSEWSNRSGRLQCKNCPDYTTSRWFRY